MEVKQKEVLAWAVEAFGDTALRFQERAARMVEEAIEVAQAEGLSPEIVRKILDRVYSRPPGDLWQELGGLMITAMALAENQGLDLHDCARQEFARVQSKTKDWWTRKHQEKIEAGTAHFDNGGYDGNAR
jgi:NTP pyrophosphatase (non-canonical NTP hydrolase)